MNCFCVDDDDDAVESDVVVLVLEVVVPPMVDCGSHGIGGDSDAKLPLLPLLLPALTAAAFHSFTLLVLAVVDVSVPGYCGCRMATTTRTMRYGSSMSSSSSLKSRRLDATGGASNAASSSCTSSCCGCGSSSIGSSRRVLADALGKESEPKLEVVVVVQTLYSNTAAISTSRTNAVFPFCE
jgi:hypothetical protein